MYLLFITWRNLIGIKVWNLIYIEPDYESIGNYNVGEADIPQDYSTTWIMLSYQIYIQIYQVLVCQFSLFNSYNYIGFQIFIVSLSLFEHFKYLIWFNWYLIID